MYNILIINFDVTKLKNIDNCNFQTKPTKATTHILTETLELIPTSMQYLVLRNIQSVSYDLLRSITLHQCGQNLTGFSIISSNCMAGFINRFINNPQIGPCAFWRYDPNIFFDQLLLGTDTFFTNLLMPLTYMQKNGHYYATNPTYKISFNHYKKMTNDQIQNIYETRLLKFNPGLYLIVICIDKLSYSYEQLVTFATKYPNSIIITNYDYANCNVFSYPNDNPQFYLKSMHFLDTCSMDDVTRFANLILTATDTVKIQSLTNQQLETLNIISTLSSQLEHKKRQLKHITSSIHKNQT